MLIFIGYTFVWSLIMGKQQPKPVAQQNQQELADKKDTADKPANTEKQADAEKPAEPGVREANVPEAARPPRPNRLCNGLPSVRPIPMKRKTLIDCW